MCCQSFNEPFEEPGYTRQDADFASNPNDRNPATVIATPSERFPTNLELIQTENKTVYSQVFLHEEDFGVLRKQRHPIAGLLLLLSLLIHLVPVFAHLVHSPLRLFVVLERGLESRGDGSVSAQSKESRKGFSQRGPCACLRVDLVGLAHVISSWVGPIPPEVITRS